MIQIDGLAEVVLNVRDADRAVAFYGGLLGLERMTPEGQAGTDLLSRGAGDRPVPSLLVLVPLAAGCRRVRCAEDAASPGADDPRRSV